MEQMVLPGKVCTKCQEWKALEDFPPRKGRPLGVQSACRDCRKVGHSDWYRRNADKHNAKRRELRKSDPDLRERENAVKAQWYRRNRERAVAQIKAWQQANPDRVKATAKASNARRRARRADMAVYTISAKDMRRLLSQPCAVPGCDGSPLQVDHIIPVSRGGSHGVGNLQMLCRFHNISKHKRTWFEYLVHLRRVTAQAN